MTAMFLLVLAAISALAAWRPWVVFELPPQFRLEPSARPAEAEADEAPAIIRRAVRPAVVLAHGLAGFDSVGLGELRVAYFRRVARELEGKGFDVVTTRVPPISALPVRAAALATAVAQLPHDRVTIVGHSMGGLDARWAISHGLAGRVSDLVTIGTPHRGTPLADILARGPAARARDWMARLGLPTDAIDWLTTWKLAALAEEMQDASEVRYTSVVGVVHRIQVHPLLLAPHLYLTLVAGPNDGMVPETSQRWGTVILSERADHFAQIGWAGGDAADLVHRSLERLRLLPASVVALAEPLALPVGATLAIFPGASHPADSGSTRRIGGGTLEELSVQHGGPRVSQQQALAELMEEHRRLEQSLEELAARRALTPTEQLEVARLKKQKLLTKDRIARLSGGA